MINFNLNIIVYQLNKSKMPLIQTEKIRIYRHKKGFSQEFVANHLGVCQSTYQKIEAGETKISAERLMQVASILEQPLESFLSKENKYIENQHNSNNQNVNGLVINYSEQQIEFMQKMLTQQEKRILELEAKIERRDKKIVELKEIVNTINNQ